LISGIIKLLLHTLEKVILEVHGKGNIMTHSALVFSSGFLCLTGYFSLDFDNFNFQLGTMELSLRNRLMHVHAWSELDDDFELKPRNAWKWS
jgi:hypothetical protein